MLTFHEHLSSPLVLNCCCPCLFSFIVVLSFSIYLLLLIISWYLLTLHRKKKSSKIKHKNNCVLVHNLGQIFIPPLPEGGGGYTVLPLSVCPSVLPSVLPSFHLSFRPSKIFFVAFFSVTVDGRNLIFGHKLHIGTPYRGKRFWTHQIPASYLPILLIFIHIEHICTFFVTFF